MDNVQPPRYFLGGYSTVRVQKHKMIYPQYDFFTIWAMRREVSAEDRVSGPEAGLSLRERKSIRYSGTLPSALIW